ncbi:Mg2+ transporter protein CorA-like/Zinc transport protein ZntB [Lasiodiplodia theobromae]|uniref:Mg2+ transporter protein CorA-like/Zinc transport protein ZntB n=1 Tax=Lasiodiplodia theobromae TaxID=45133 RepID=UPI0015C34E27|nr:Mg2+ transporter protein CorA-like/Zinc transport protein ZntB [Lasiodiplodia theobromae]KAF4541778.1 Mg2+ transporter protein CorA-like/Zinc transport protein ZntB [Lasiodiplodia theobromae]
MSRRRGSPPPSRPSHRHYYNSSGGACPAPYSRDHGGRHVTRTRPEQRFATAAADIDYGRRRRRTEDDAIAAATARNDYRIIEAPADLPVDFEYVPRSSGNRRTAAADREYEVGAVGAGGGDDDYEYREVRRRRERSRSRPRSRSRIRRYRDYTTYTTTIPTRHSVRVGRTEDVVAEAPAAGGEEVAAEMPERYGEEIAFEESPEDLFGDGGGGLGYEEREGMRYGDFMLSMRSKDVFGVFATGLGEEGEGDRDVSDAKEEEGGGAVGVNGIDATSAVGSAHETRYRVLFSQWVENGSGGEDPVAELVVEMEKGVGTRGKARRGLYEWVHVKQDFMNFEAFTRRVEKAGRLNQEEKKYVSKVLRGISRQFEKPLLTQDGMQGRYMMANFNQEFDDTTGAPGVAFICLPFFTLEKYGPPRLPENSKAHPKRTLLQTLFSSASRAQDLQQAVTQLPNTPKDFLFHVRQIWAFIVDDKFMITCSGEDPPSIARDSITITSQPLAADAVKSTPRYIEVSDECMNIWLLPLEKCKTWFMLHSNFFDTMVDYDIEAGFSYTITFDSTVLSENDWPKVYEKAQRTTVRISISSGDSGYSLRIPTITPGGYSDDDAETLVSEPSSVPVILPDLELTKDQFHVFTWLASTSNSEDRSDKLSDIEELSRISTYAKRLRDLSKNISDLEVPPPSQSNPPDKFVVAWIHTCLAVCHWKPSDMSAFDHHLERSENELVSGLPSFLRSFQDKPLENRAAAMPLGILSLLTQELLMDFTGMRPDVFTSYRDYYYQLKHRMDEDPLNRAHQKSINAFKQELEAITNVLNQQLTVLTDFGLALEQRKQHAGRTLFSAPYAVAPNVVDNCAAAVDSKIRGFAGMRQNAEALRLASLEMIDSNKDRQEAAIYAFTIVTIVFLPLSFVSGFMGMNTADIRDMPHRQWVFWAAGIPLTILIILLGLIGAEGVEAL